MSVPMDFSSQFDEPIGYSKVLEVDANPPIISID